MLHNPFINFKQKNLKLPIIDTVYAIFMMVKMQKSSLKS
jgi:hypothetical protein